MTKDEEDALVTRVMETEWDERELRLAIRAAVAQERERCAKDERIRELEGGSFTLQGASAESLDAARYRYLRNVAGQVDGDYDGPMICEGLGDLFDYLRGEECDEAVDAAIAQFGSARAALEDK